MHIYDISKELFSAPVYPGDPLPKKEHIQRIAMGDSVNLSSFYQCVHNGTHVDAPLHFYEDGASIDAFPLNPFIGECVVISVEPGILTGDDIERLMPKPHKRVLFKGNGKCFLSQSAAFVLASEGVILVGTDAGSIAYQGDEQAPHKELLGKNIPLLEGLDLSEVATDGKYFLCAVPLKLAGFEASPVRAVLADGIIEF